MRDQHRIVHCHRDHIGQTYTYKFETVHITAQQAVLAINGCYRSISYHAVRRIGSLAPDGIPIAKVGPPRRKRHNAKVVCPLHHGVIDRDIRGAGPWALGDPDNLALMRGICQRAAHGG